jgi:hypothetical protein
VSGPTPSSHHPEGHVSLRVEDSDTQPLVAAARELEAHLLHEQARHLADVRALLAELYERDGVAVEDAMLDAQAEDVAFHERGERFLQELATWLHPSAELLELASQLDDHALGVWREAAASLVEVCPPSLAQLRWRVEEEQRAELRSHAYLVRTEARLVAQQRRLGLIGRVWQRGWVAQLGAELADCRRREERSGQRLAHLDAKLQVVDRTEHARAAWIAHARAVLVRGMVAIQLLAERDNQDHASEQVARPAGPVTVEDRVWHARGRDRPQASGASLHLAQLHPAGRGQGGVRVAEPAGG